LTYWIRISGDDTEVISLLWSITSGDSEEQEFEKQRKTLNYWSKNKLKEPGTSLFKNTIKARCGGTQLLRKQKQEHCSPRLVRAKAWDPIWKTKSKKRTGGLGGVIQVVEYYLPNKALSAVKSIATKSMGEVIRKLLLKTITNTILWFFI
jgi:hypothetical protein